MFPYVSPGPPTLSPFPLDRRCPAVRRGARGVRVLPARPADDRQLPAVPPPQGLEIRRPLHELHKRGKRVIFFFFFPTQLTELLGGKTPSRSSPTHALTSQLDYGTKCHILSSLKKKKNQGLILVRLLQVILCLNSSFAF